MSNEARARIEAYLGTLQAGLRDVEEQEAQEFLQEIRSHVQEKISGGGETTPSSVEKVLAALGNPQELAREYKTSVLLARTAGSGSPIRILPILFRWARFSIAGLFVLLATIAGYFVGGVLLICAMLKPFHPHTVGLWAFHDETGDLTLSFRLGTANPSAGARELLGWWIVPIGVLVALGLVLSTSRLALWCARKLRRASVFDSDESRRTAGENTGA